MKRVEQALNTPANEPISAESNPATTMPRSPAGNMYLTISGNAPWEAAVACPVWESYTCSSPGT